MPTFSIVVPLYNASDYVSEALRSIAQQVFPDFEVIIVDDGSTDGSGAIAEKFCQTDRRFKYVRQERAGPSAARNVGIERACGTYLYFLDSDDRIAPDALQTCDAQFRAVDVDVVLFNGVAFPSDSPMYGHFKDYYRRPRVDGPISSGRFIVESLRAKRYFVSPCCYVAKRSVVGALRFPEGMIYEDNVFFLALLVERSRTVSILSRELFQRRLRPKSIMSSERSIENYDSMNKVLHAVMRLSFGALEASERSEVKVAIVGMTLRSLCVISSSIGPTAILRLRNVVATIRAALRVSPRFLTPDNLMYAIWPERLERSGKPSPEAAGD